MLLQELNNGRFDLLRIRGAEEMEATIDWHELSVFRIDEELDLLFSVGN